jgi:hypothetical protein
MGLLQIAVLVTGLGAMAVGQPQPLSNVVAFVVGSTIVSAVPLLLTFNRERFERGQFLTTYLLVEERNDERRKREQTESMLHVLSQRLAALCTIWVIRSLRFKPALKPLLYFVDEKNESGAAPENETPVTKPRSGNSRKLFSTGPKC